MLTFFSRYPLFWLIALKLSVHRHLIDVLAFDCHDGILIILLCMPLHASAQYLASGTSTNRPMHIPSLLATEPNFLDLAENRCMYFCMAKS